MNEQPNPSTVPPPSNLSNKEIARTLQRSIKHPFRWGMIIGGTIAVAVVLLIAQNGESAQIHWLWFHFSAPLWLFLFLTLIAGGLVWETAKASIRRGQQVSAARRAALKQLAGGKRLPRPSPVTPPDKPGVP